MAKAVPNLSPAYVKVAAALNREGGIEERPRAADQPFGATGLKATGKMFAMAVEGTLVLKLPAERVSELVRQGAGSFHDPGNGKPLKDWIRLSAADRRWLALAREAREWARGGK